MSSEVVCEVDARRASLTLNRPEKLNALNVALVAALETQARLVSGLADVDVVLVRGAGRSFCAGLDLDMFAADGMSPEFYRRQEGGFRVLEVMDKTVIAAIHGHCLGGGVQLAAACDVRVASSDAVLGLPAIDEGLFPGMAPYRLPRLIGKGRAASLILSGRRLSAQDAYAIGLVDVTSPRERRLGAGRATGSAAPPRVRGARCSRRSTGRSRRSAPGTSGVVEAVAGRPRASRARAERGSTARG